MTPLAKMSKKCYKKDHLFVIQINVRLEKMQTIQPSIEVDLFGDKNICQQEMLF